MFPTIALLHFHAKKTDTIQSSICFEEGLTLETLALETLFMVANLHHQLSWLYQFIILYPSLRQHHGFLWNLPPSIRTILGVWKWLLEQYLSHVTNAHFRFSEVSDHFG